MHLDIRTILLGKVKPGNKPTYDQLFKNNIYQGTTGNRSINNFITIGNYDCAMVYKTEEFLKVFPDCQLDFSNEAETCSNSLANFEKEKRILTKLCKVPSDKDSPNAFYHPLHIICHENDQKVIEDFWRRKNACFAMVLIYGGIDSQDYPNGINISNNKIVDLQTVIEQKLIHCKNDFLIYRSVNLSELVLIFKADSLKNILDNIVSISYNYPSLKTHTVCGFRYDTDNNCIMDENISDEKQEEISLVKVTGTIQSHTQAEKIFNELMFGEAITGNQIAFGNNDFNLIFKDVGTKTIVETLNKWLEKSADIKTAFSSLKTRVHVEYKQTSKNASHYVSNQAFQNLISKLQELVWKCYQKQPEYTTWVYPFVEALNLLSDMYNNAELARVQYFTIDTLWVLARTLGSILKNEKTVDQFLKDNEEHLNRFVFGLTALIERIVRVDGYLSQEPGYSPLVYNMIPAGILEFYCSYIFELTQTVNEFNDSIPTNNFIYATLALPEWVSQISFEDILPNNENPGQLSQVNLLSIPYNQIYHPESLLFSVTHEIMHFCGEATRLREIRYTQLIYFIFEYIIFDFDLSICHQPAFKMLENFFDCRIAPSKRLYAKPLFAEIKTCIEEFYGDIALKNELCRMVHEQSNGDIELFHDHVAWINDASVEISILSCLNDIEYLFKECYADLMTVKFLNISSVDYYELLQKMENKNSNISEEENNIIDCTLLLRNALVIYTINKQADTLHGVENLPNRIRCLLKILRDIDKGTIREKDLTYFVSTVLKSPYSFSDLFYCPGCLKALITYLWQCSKKYNQLSKSKKNAKAVQKIREIYSTGINTEDLFNDKYCNIVYEVREKIHDRVKRNCP